MDTAKCKGCGAEIVWGQTAEGKRMPLDAKPERRFIRALDENGTWRGKVMTMDTYISHFATCPQAADFRRTR